MIRRGEQREHDAKPDLRCEVEKMPGWAFVLMIVVLVALMGLLAFWGDIITIFA